MKYFSSEAQPSIAKEHLFKIYERILLKHCYSCFSQGASSDNEYLEYGEFEIQYAEIGLSGNKFTGDNN